MGKNKKQTNKGGSFRKEDQEIECETCQMRKIVSQNVWACQVCGRIATHKEQIELEKGKV